MSALHRLWRDTRGNAAVEMVLITPLILIVMFGSVEVGNFFYDEHRLVKAVRDGARYAARKSFSNFTACSGQVPTAGTSGTVFENTKLMVRKGTLDSTAEDLLPKWNDQGVQFDVTMSCKTSLDDGSGGNYTLGGIYANVSAPTVVVTASVPYQSVFGMAFGWKATNVKLSATQSAAVMGL